MACKHGSHALYQLYYDDCMREFKGDTSVTFEVFCPIANVLLEERYLGKAVTTDACRWGLAFNVFEALQRRRAESSLTRDEERAHVVALKAFMREWDAKIDG